MPKQPESRLVVKIKRLFERKGGRTFKIQGMKEGFQEIGIPDILICFRGMFIGIEVKQPGGRLRSAQRVVLHEIYAAGGIAAVCETVQQAELLLSTIEKRGQNEALSAMCFDRGTIKYHCSFS